jgi:hypothetical protein
MTRGKTMRAATAVITAVLVFSTAAPALADTGTVDRSALLPGLGQAHQGHYTRATIFASAAIISWAGLFASQLNYARSTERYENSKRTYLYYPTQVQNGDVVSAQEIDETYQSMSSAYDDAEGDAKWRNFFIGALVVTYTVNIVDIIVSKPDSGERERDPAVSVEWDGNQMRVVRTIRF